MDGYVPKLIDLFELLAAVEANEVINSRLLG